jgi:DNA-binding response OmpR family regulator
VEPPLDFASCLVADDSPTSADAIASFLVTAGYRVRVTYSAADAVRFARKELPDVAILGVERPNLMGIAEAKQLGDMEGAKPLLIALVGTCTLEEERRALEAGFDHYLRKPVQPRSLYSIVNKVRESKRKNGADDTREVLKIDTSIHKPLSDRKSR